MNFIIEHIITLCGVVLGGIADYQAIDFKKRKFVKVTVIIFIVFVSVLLFKIPKSDSVNRMVVNGNQNSLTEINIGSQNDNQDVNELSVNGVENALNNINIGSHNQ